MKTKKSSSRQIGTSFVIQLFNCSIVLLFLFPPFGGIKGGYAQLVVNNTLTPTQLVQNVLLGGGVTAFNITYTGANDARGTFSNGNVGTNNIGIASGVLLTTGPLNIAVGPNNASNAGQDNNFPGDPDLNALIPGYTTYNATILEFNFVPISDTIRFNYVFASEEYHEFVNSNYNDVFGFLLSGPNPTGGNYVKKNIALIPGTTTPVSINNVNAGWISTLSNAWPGTNPSNSAYFIANGNGNGAGNVPNNVDGPVVQYDGFTVVLEAWAHVVPCDTYHIKLAIADAGDGMLDSGVFLEAGSFTSPGVSLTTSATINDSTTIEGCGAAIFTFTRTGLLDSTICIPITITGTAINGVDYADTAGAPVDTFVCFQAGDTVVQWFIDPIYDGVSEGTEIVTVIIPQVLSCDDDSVSITNVYILNVDPFTVDVGPDTIICPEPGANAVLTATGSGGAGITIYTWTWPGGSTTGNPITVYPTQTTDYIVTVSDTCLTAPAQDTVRVIVQPEVIVNLGQDTTICTHQIYNITSGDYDLGYSYKWYLNGEQLPVTSYTYPANVQGNYVLIVIDTIGCEGSDSLFLTVEPCPIDIPNIFTPNGDGINDVFFLTENMDAYTNSTLIIFNRWGNKVYETDNYQNDWKGTNKQGRDVPTGVYYYILKLSTGEEYKGNVTIMR